MEVKELGHLVLYVHDLQRSAAFYGEVLGWRRITAQGLPVAAFSSGRTHHELLLIEVGPDAQEQPRGRRVGLYHFGLKVADSDAELRAVLAQVQEHGVKLVGTADHTVTHSLYIEDPDGNEIELYADVPGVDWRSDPDLLLSPIRPLTLEPAAPSE
ncbi:MAG: VOC family protein [Candidatus Dormibacteria bacterium]